MAEVLTKIGSILHIFFRLLRKTFLRDLFWLSNSQSDNDCPLLTDEADCGTLIIEAFGVESARLDGCKFLIGLLLFQSLGNLGRLLQLLGDGEVASLA